MKPISGFPDYQITKDGKVWSNPRKYATPRGQWLKPENRKGYLSVVLTINFLKYHCAIHRLVLETYVGLCPLGMEACHNNGNRQDNRLGNLRWDTSSNNHKDAIKHGTMRRGEGHGRAKLTNDKVRIIRYLWKVAKFTLTDLAWQFDVAISTIGRICKRKYWKHI